MGGLSMRIISSTDKSRIGLRGRSLISDLREWPFSDLTHYHLGHYTSSPLWKQISSFVSVQSMCQQQQHLEREWLFVSSLSVRFNGHFPGWPGLTDIRMSPFWILLELRMMEVELYDVQSSSQIVTTDKPTPSFLQAECHSVAQPTMSEHWRENSFLPCLIEFTQ